MIVVGATVLAVHVGACCCEMTFLQADRTYNGPVEIDLVAVEVEEGVSDLVLEFVGIQVAESNDRSNSLFEIGCCRSESKRPFEVSQQLISKRLSLLSFDSAT